jgi:hypothetical protein
MHLPQQKYKNLFPYLLRNFLLVGTGSIVLTILLLVITLQTRISSFFSGIVKVLQPSVSSARVEPSSLVLRQIRSVSELTTAIFVMEAVVPTSQDFKLGDVAIATTKLLYIGRGEVKAGINLNDLKEENIVVKGKEIQVNLPASKILDSKIDINNSRVYDYNRGLLNLGPDVAPDLQSLAQRETLRKIVNTACQEGILTQAEEKARTAIAQLLITTGYEKVEVKISKNSSSSCINQ